MTSYYVVMVNYGDRGHEAVVDPADDRDAVVKLMVSGEVDPDRVAFVHHVTAGKVIVDVTGDIMSEVENEIQNDAERAWERHCDRYYGGGYDTLEEKKMDARRFK